MVGGGGGGGEGGGEEGGRRRSLAFLEHICKHPSKQLQPCLATGPGYSCIRSQMEAMQCGNHSILNKMHADMPGFMLRGQ
eukprot:1153184-Pelagomonas_calceolata.AAC.2